MPSQEHHLSRRSAMLSTLSASVGSLCASVLQAKESESVPDRWAIFGDDAAVSVAALRYTGHTPITVQARACIQRVIKTQTLAGDMHAGGHALLLEDDHWHFVLHNGKHYVRATSDMPAMRAKPVDVAGLCDGVQVRLYIDGVLQRSAPQWSGRYRPSGKLWMVGADPDADSKPQHRLDGSIAHIRVSTVARDQSANWKRSPFADADAADMLYLSAGGNAVEPFVHRAKVRLAVNQAGLLLRDASEMQG